MNTISTYIEKYGNVSFEKMPLCEADIFLTSILSYVPHLGFDGIISFEKLICEVVNVDKKDMLGSVAPLCLELAKKLKETTRYQGVLIENFEKQIDNKTQFGAMTFHFGKQKVIAFEGTAGTTIGWYENFRLMYESPTYSQVLAKEYLNSAISNEDENVIICGHSKGGNLAMSAACECAPDKQDKISIVYNFDGPGFWPEYVKSEAFQKMEHKIRNIIPQGSYVGALMCNNGKYTIVKSSGIALAVHYPTTWCIPETEFVRNGRMSSVSEHIYTLSTIGLGEVNKEELREVLEAAFSGMDKPGGSKMKITFSDLTKAIDNIKSTSPVTKEFLRDIARAFGKLAIKTKLEEEKKNV